MGTRRKICVVTGTRAEYGLLYWLMWELRNDPNIELQIIVTGMHLSPEFGLTYRVIQQDGFLINEKVEMLLSSDSAAGVIKSMGLANIGFADALERLRPDVLVILGDRFEALSAVQAALIFKVPVAHIHGGELTTGAFDNSIRHSITKMAHLHYTAAEPYRKCVIQMGEQPDRVFNFGAVGLDHLERTPRLSRLELEKRLQFCFGNTNFLLTYHPVTLNESGVNEAFGEVLRALDDFPEARIIFTLPNADPGSRRIMEMIRTYSDKHKDRCGYYASLGQELYLSTLAISDIVIGNSSSAVIEAPALGKPTVNIGDRQDGRLFARSIVTCQEQHGKITKAIKMALSADFQKEIGTMELPYGKGGASSKIKEHLSRVNLNGLLKKKFYDISF